MIKIAVFPCTSPRGGLKNQQSVIDEIVKSLNSFGDYEINVIYDSSGAIPEHDVALLFVLGGGSEPSMLKVLQKTQTPILALALPTGNALAAALDVISIVRNTERKAFLVQASFGWEHELKQLLQVLICNKLMQTSRIGVIGTRDFEVMAPLDLKACVQKSWGPELVYISLDELIKSVKETDPIVAESSALELIEGASEVVEPDTKTSIEAAQIYFALKKIVQNYKLDAVTVKCFDLLPSLKNTSCYALARLNEEGTPAGCEGDVLSVLGMLFLHHLTNLPVFMANPVTIDVKNGLLHVAHCTIARTMVDSYVLRSHMESGIGVGLQGHTDSGPTTVFRLGGAELKETYASNAAILESTALEDMCRTQFRIQIPQCDNPSSIVRRPLGNHHLIVKGHWKDCIEEYVVNFVKG